MIRLFTLALALLIPLAANAICLGKSSSSCWDMIEVYTDNGWKMVLYWDRRGRIIDGSWAEQANGTRCNTTGGDVDISPSANIDGVVYFTCGNMYIWKSKTTIPSYQGSIKPGSPFGLLFTGKFLPNQ